jgi:1-acyl-sn-glycerol-3-phosphate acyltransferase
MLRFVFQPFYTLFVLVLFVASLLLIYPFFLIMGLRDSPGSRRLTTRVVQFWARKWLWIIGMPARTMGVFPANKKFIIVANHISYLDTINIYAVIPEYFRTLARKEMVRVPLFGVVYKQLAILVDRSSHRSRARSMRFMWRQLRNEGHIALFPEGSFNETGETMKDFYDGAFRLAINSQMPLLPVLFPDTEERWHYSAWWKLWPGKNRAVFLHPVFVNGLTLKDLPELKERVRRMMEEELDALRSQNGPKIPVQTQG